MLGSPKHTTIKLSKLWKKDYPQGTLFFTIVQRYSIQEIACALRTEEQEHRGFAASQLVEGYQVTGRLRRAEISGRAARLLHALWYPVEGRLATRRTSGLPLWEEEGSQLTRFGLGGG